MIIYTISQEKFLKSNFFYKISSPGGEGGGGSNAYFVLFLLLTMLSIASCIYWCCWCMGYNPCGCSPVMITRNPNPNSNYLATSKVHMQKPNGEKIYYCNQPYPPNFVPGSSYNYYGR